MWFFFRFFVATYIQKIKPTKHILEWVSAPYRVMPWDLDANLHMNNVKYLKYLERGRVEHMIHTPWLRNMYRSNAKALIANTEVSYVKEMRLFQKFNVETRISSWDEKYLYIEQVFADGKTIFTCSVTRMATVDMKTHKRLSATEVLAKAFAESSAPPLPESAQHLNALIKAQRQETQAITHIH